VPPDAIWLKIPPLSFQILFLDNSFILSVCSLCFPFFPPSLFNLFKSLPTSCTWRQKCSCTRISDDDGWTRLARRVHGASLQYSYMHNCQSRFFLALMVLYVKYIQPSRRLIRCTILSPCSFDRASIESVIFLFWVNHRSGARTQLASTGLAQTKRSSSTAGRTRL
jgi:hypothetical protein